MAIVRQLNSTGVVLSVINLDKAPSRLTFGRDRGNDIVLVDPRVSRIHTFIVRENGQFIIRDNESRNGTWVNGSEIREHILKDGDRFTIGSGRFLFQAGELDGMTIPPEQPKPEIHPFMDPDKTTREWDVEADVFETVEGDSIFQDEAIFMEQKQSHTRLIIILVIGCALTGLFLWMLFPQLQELF